VLLGRVDSFDIIDVNPAIAIAIKLVKGLGDQLLAASIHRSSHSTNEFIIIDSATAVIVEVIVKSANLGIGETKHVILHSFGEFIKIERSRIVIIHNSELFANADDSTGTSGGKLAS
jgi:hypothetical protein